MSPKPNNARGSKAAENMTDIDGATGQPINQEAQANDIPLDGDEDKRSQLTKLALSGMGCQPELSVARDQMVTINGKEQMMKVGQDVHQATIFGYITGLTGPKELPNAKNGQDAITFGLVGQIEGLNVLTGEMFKAGILYLPGGFHEMFLSEMEMALGDGAKPQIAFALEFWSVPAGNPRGYTWKAKNKLPMEKADPLARLRARALAGTKVVALSAPTGKALPSGGIA